MKSLVLILALACPVFAQSETMEADHTNGAGSSDVQADTTLAALERAPEEGTHVLEGLRFDDAEPTGDGVSHWIDFHDSRYRSPSKIKYRFTSPDLGEVQRVNPEIFKMPMRIRFDLRYTGYTWVAEISVMEWTDKTGKALIRIR